MEYLHRAGIVHGDIRGNSVLVSRQHTAMLRGDFNLVTLADTETQWRPVQETTRWTSPEVLNGNEKTFASDIYGFGMTIYEVRRPFITPPLPVKQLT